MDELLPIVILDLKPDLNKINSKLVLHYDPRAIEEINKIREIVVRHFGRPWIYAGSFEPRERNENLATELKKLENSDQLIEMTTEKKTPALIVIVPEQGDKKEFHDHINEMKTSFQLEEYIISDGDEILLEVRSTEVEKIKVKGPSVVFIGPIAHRREYGKCFVVKTPSDDYKKVV
jgi:hypothetical protein